MKTKSKIVVKINFKKLNEKFYVVKIVLIFFNIKELFKTLKVHNSLKRNITINHYYNMLNNFNFEDIPANACPASTD